MQAKEGESGKNMLKAYGRTIVGMSPIWLMGEAITGKVGALFCFGHVLRSGYWEERTGSLLISFWF